MKSRSYGIIAITHIHGVSCECDEVHFDGWYSNCPSVIQEMFELFKKRYPEADVFIVEQKQAEWRMLETLRRREVLAQIMDDFAARREATGT
jgi:hypothetical protein